MEHIKIQLKQILDEFGDLKLLKNNNFKLHPNNEYYIDGLQVVIDFKVPKEYYAKIIVKYKDVDIFKISSSNEKHISDCLFEIRTVIDDKIKTLKKQTKSCKTQTTK